MSSDEIYFILSRPQVPFGADEMWYAATYCGVRSSWIDKTVYHQRNVYVCGVNVNDDQVHMVRLSWIWFHNSTAYLSRPYEIVYYLSCDEID